jgi:hypothetical protein
MTVGRLRAEMDGGEFVEWRIYYERKAQLEELERLKTGG